MDTDFEEYYTGGRLQLGINLQYCGRERCLGSHAYGPAMRDHFLLHFVVSGQGTFSATGCDYRLKAGDSFCMLPHLPAAYRADADDPWTYFWIGFGGDMARGWADLAQFSEQSPTHAHADSARAQLLFERLLRTLKADDDPAEMHSTGLLLQLLATYMHEPLGVTSPARRVTKGRNPFYARQAIRFMEEHYQKNIDVPLIAKQVGLERSYFTKLFQAEVGVPPHEFLMRYRIEKAAQLLSRTHLSIQVIANSVGFDDPASFGKAFARRRGHSPSSFRKYNQSSLPYVREKERSEADGD